MQFERAMELLNSIIDTVLERNGLDTADAIEELVELGFTKDELVQEFDFSVDDESDEDE